MNILKAWICFSVKCANLFKDITDCRSELPVLRVCVQGVVYVGGGELNGIFMWCVSERS